MSDNIKQELARLDKENLLELFFESLHLTALHYATWFYETEHQIGLDKTIEIDDLAWKRVLPTILKRITGRLDIPNKEGVPDVLNNASKEVLIELLVDMSRNWLSSDGIWFLSVEKNFDYEMNNAKRINDSCWMKFSYIEAKRIMKIHGLPANGGILVLKEALKHRQYALINTQEIIEDSPSKITFRMNECRVHVARKASNLPEYPCKSAGIAEYTRFAEAIDPRIVTTCVACPPDPHPDDWYCAWEFTLPKDKT